MSFKIFGDKILKGSFILYRKKSSKSGQMTPARLQRDINGGPIALCDITGIQPGTNGQRAKIVCGPVKWFDVDMLRISVVSEDALLSAPTVEGVK
jgi:hypothetical protein